MASDQSMILTPSALVLVLMPPTIKVVVAWVNSSVTAELKLLTVLPLESVTEKSNPVPTGLLPEVSWRALFCLIVRVAAVVPLPKAEGGIITLMPLVASSQVPPCAGVIWQTFGAASVTFVVKLKLIPLAEEPLISKGAEYSCSAYPSAMANNLQVPAVTGKLYAPDASTCAPENPPPSFSARTNALDAAVPLTLTVPEIASEV